jgi:hypothetical protein
MFKYGIIAALSLFLACTTTNSKKEFFELSGDGDSLIITGTAPMHDWKMYLETFDCHAAFIMNGTRLDVIDEVTFICKATDLKSDNPSMDKRAHSALNSEKFPEIKFNMTSPIKISLNNNRFTDNMKGDLFVAGNSKGVSILLRGSINNQNGTNIIEVSGETSLKMSDFDISPPSFLMGAFRTGDIVTLSFTLQFLQK